MSTRIEKQRWIIQLIRICSHHWGQIPLITICFCTNKPVIQLASMLWDVYILHVRDSWWQSEYSPLPSLTLSPTTVTGGLQPTELPSSEWEAVKYLFQWGLRDILNGGDFNIKSSCQAATVKTFRNSTETEQVRNPEPLSTFQIFWKPKRAYIHTKAAPLSSPWLYFYQQHKG